ncbi:hypothetical protein AGOR_G00182770 [Albula goreensis]|uniref:HTH CENPB-type domain-containing protein n=1 Tax=Albula goreensis TaxID=1534307 RepID=A0A8T3CWV7_9TELE|nr:hypothetical protein AGOR_G00182770 [Albula goreensis]
MGPKRPASDSAGGKPTKRARNVMTLEKKLDVVNRLGRGESAASVARLMGVNESTIRTIKKSEAAIKASIASGTAASAKVTYMPRDPIIEKMEKALNVWIEDQTQKKVTLNSAVIREQALRMYECLGGSSAWPAFQASKGWFERFLHRYSLRKRKLVGEAASVDHGAAETYPEQLKKLIEDKGYLPEQVFNAGETGLFWKRMPSRTYISKAEHTAPGFKAANDRVNLLLCANASGDCMVKPMLVYRSLNPRALKGKNKCHLPVFWRANKKAWVTGTLTMDWLNNCFVRDVERYLTRKNLAFKVLLILENAPGHPEALQFAHPNVEVVFLPPNTTSLLQPMDQGIIETFKRYYTRRTFNKILDAVENDPGLTVADCWKRYNIADSISIIKDSLDEVNQSTLNACWSKLWKEAVHDLKGFPNISAEVKQIVDAARSLEGEGLADTNEEDVKQLLQSHKEELTEVEIAELIMSSDDEEDESERSNKMTLVNLSKGLLLANNLADYFIDIDPFMERSLKFKRGLEELLAPYKQLQKDFQNKIKHSSILSYFKLSSESADCKPQSSTSKAPQPSTSSPLL